MKEGKGSTIASVIKFLLVICIKVILVCLDGMRRAIALFNAEGSMSIHEWVGISASCGTEQKNFVEFKAG